MSAEPFLRVPSVDVPSLSIRWEGLVVAVDAHTLNTLLRKAIRGARGIKEILVEPDDGRLGVTVRVRKGISVPFRGHLDSLRFKDGFLGFLLADLTAFGFLPIPHSVVRRIIDRLPKGRILYYPEERVIVLNLNSLLPQELSVQIQEVQCENGEIRIVFGPSQYRLDRLIEEIGKDPFEE